MSWDVVVLGGGAAGLMAALRAAQRGRSVLVLEHNARVGEKIRISGGGRCNFTNLGASPANYVSSNPRFCSSALARFTPRDFVALVERHGIAYHEKTLGQLFCDGSSQQIIDLLLAELNTAGGTVRTECAVYRVEQVPEGFLVDAGFGAVQARALVVATGGLSIPKLGATPLAYDVATQFEIPVVPPHPALVPLTWNADDARVFGDLSGVSFDCTAQADGPVFREQALITHRGLSGPAILQASSFWREGQPVTLDLDPENQLLRLLEESKRAGRKAELRTLIAQVLPQRLAQRLCELHAWHGPVNTTKDAKLREIAARLRAWQVVPGGTEGYRKAEVTAGGIDTRALEPKTMQARNTPGLYFIGECVDVTGWLGGYNFQWAWASGHAVGEAL